MLHMKHLGVLWHFLHDFNREIYGRSLIGKVPLSQKSIALVLDEMESLHILKSRKEGNMKFFSLNLLNTGIKDFLVMAEYAKKMDFMGRHRDIANIFDGDDRVIGIFGSYARNAEKKGSDLDIFIIGDKRKEQFLEKGRMLDIDVSAKYFSEKDFIRLMKEKNNLCKEIIKDHVLVNGSEHFINLVWRHYYGFD